MKKPILLIVVLHFSCDVAQEKPDCAGIVSGNSICGCMDNSAVNYLPEATHDDTSCEYEPDCDGNPEGETLCGCTDNSAANFDSEAVYDDSSCAYTVVQFIWESSGSEENYFEIHKDGFQYVFRVLKFAGDSLNVIGYVDESEPDIYSTVNGISIGIYNLTDYTDSPDEGNFPTTLTLVYETGWSQSFDSAFPDYPIGDVYDYVELNVVEWCPENYYSIESECYNAGDMTILQELVGNFAPSVLISMEESEWENSRLIHFHCQGCILESALPDSMGNLTELRELIISNTLLSGGLPESLFDLEYLDVMVLNDNRLSGTIPESVCNFEVGNMIIELDNNQFCPPFPECIEEYIGVQDTTQCNGG